MKHFYYKYLLALFCIVFYVDVQASSDICINGIYYEFYTYGSERRATVSYNYEHRYTGSIIIPSSVVYKGTIYPVKRIGSNAFYNCKELNNVTIPNSVIEIESDAFMYCSLTSITLPNSVTKIMNRAFQGCEELNSITLGNGLESISYDAFKYCDNIQKVIIKDISSWCNVELSNEFSNPLKYAHHIFSNENTEITNLVIPNTVTSIKGGVFEGCSYLISVTVPNSVTEIYNKAFSGCTSLKEVSIDFEEIANNYPLKDIFGNQVETYNLGNNVKTIGEKSFYSYNNLKNVTIGKNVYFVGDSAFANCNLSVIVIPANVTSIGYDAFRGNSMTSIIVENGNPNYDSRDNSNAIINTKTNTLIKGCNTSIIPDGIIRIEDHAFDNCKELVTIVIPTSITTIGKGAFYGCEKLNSIDIPNDITKIEADVFRNCFNLAKVKIPNNISVIGNGAFYGCTALETITLPNCLEVIGSLAFSGCGLKTVIIPNGGKELGNSVFKNCKSLETVGIPGSIKEVPESAFEGSGLKSIVIPNGTESIGLRAFKDCNSLETVVIPNTITTIGSNAFADCLSLYSVTSLINMPFKLNETAFQYTGSDYSKDIVYMAATLYVPRGRTAMYSNVEGWKKFLNIMETDTKFKLTYMVDGEEYKTYEIQAAEIITPEPDPYKEGYIFSGWSDIPYLMPAHDVTVTGSFTLDMTGINATATGNATPKVYYTVDGHRLNGQKRGLNIIRMSDGTVRKVMVK